MNTIQLDALARFERYYSTLDQALDAEDCDAIASVVDERAGALAEMLDAFSGAAIPDHVRQRVELAESRVRGRLAALHASLLRQLSESRRRQSASSRYAEAMR